MQQSKRLGVNLVFYCRMLAAVRNLRTFSIHLLELTNSQALFIDWLYVSHKSDELVGFYFPSSCQLTPFDHTKVIRALLYRVNHIGFVHLCKDY